MNALYWVLLCSMAPFAIYGMGQAWDSWWGWMMDIRQAERDIEQLFRRVGDVVEENRDLSRRLKELEKAVITKESSP